MSDPQTVAIARATSDAVDNLVTIVSVTIRLQICAGLGDDLGIANAQWVALLDGVQVLSGTTSADGELNLLMFPSETLTLRVFDTDYDITLRDAFPPISDLNGKQKRLDTLGYMTGYLQDPIGTATPDDNIDGPRTRQAILQYQTDKGLAIDSIFGTRTRDAITGDVDN